MNIGETEILIGADPEVFIRSKKTGKFVSAHGMLPGTKEEPFAVKNGAVQVDGMAAEFNIDPAKDEDEFAYNILSVMAQLQGMLGDEYELVPVPTCKFGKKMIDAQPLEAKELGCSPDFNAWTGEQNPVPNAELPYRTGSGHIHIGWTNGVSITNKEHIAQCEFLIRNLDHYTMPTMLLDTDTTRRELYGDIGAYRAKSYGVEYRTPSNYWLTSEQTIRDMYKLITYGIKRCIRGRCVFNTNPDEHDERAIRKVFNRDFSFYWETRDLVSQARNAGVNYDWRL